MKKKLSVLFLLSVIGGSGFALYKNNRAYGDKPSTDLAKETPTSVATSAPTLAPEQKQQTAGVVPDPAPVKKAKKIVTRKKPVVTE